MNAAAGDRIVISSPHVEGGVRDGEILEAHGADGAPPYLVRWSDSGHESVIYPGPDATIHHVTHDSDPG